MNNGSLSTGQKSKFPAIALGLGLAMAAPALAYTEWDNGSGTDILWSTATNWSTNAVPGVEKTVIGELDYPSAAVNTVTLNTTSSNLTTFEIFGKGVLNIETGGILNVVSDSGGDKEFKIYTGGNGAGDVGSRINLLGGTIVIQDGVFVQLGDTGLANIGLYGGNGSNVEGIGWTKVSEGGFTTYTGIPAASTLKITSITLVGVDTYEVMLEGENSTAYKFDSSPTLVFPGTQVTGLMDGTTPVGDINEDKDEVTTTAGGLATVKMVLTGSANFVRAQIPPPPPPVLEEYFDAAGPGLPDGWVAVNDPVTATTVWDVGDPSGLPNLQNGDGTNCVGTNVVTGLYADEVATVTLTSPPMSIPAGGATLSFRQYIDSDAPNGDVGAVRLLDASDTEIVGGDFPVTGIDGIEAGWTPRSYELPPSAAGQDVKVVFEFSTNADGNFFNGFYIDDVVVTGN